MKGMNLLKDAKKLSDKKLIEEWKQIDEHIKLFSYGRFELVWRMTLEKEIDERGLENDRF